MCGHSTAAATLTLQSAESHAPPQVGLMSLIVVVQSSQICCTRVWETKLETAANKSPLFLLLVLTKTLRCTVTTWTSLSELVVSPELLPPAGEDVPLLVCAVVLVSFSVVPAGAVGVEVVRSDVAVKKVSLSSVLNAVFAETDADVGSFVASLVSIDVKLLLVVMGSDVVVSENVVQVDS